MEGMAEFLRHIIYMYKQQHWVLSRMPKNFADMAGNPGMQHVGAGWSLYAMNTFENHINDCLVAGDGDDISLSSVGPPSEHVTGDAAAYHPTYCVLVCFGQLNTVPVWGPDNWYTSILCDVLVVFFQAGS